MTYYRMLFDLILLTMCIIYLNLLKIEEEEASGLDD